MLEHVGVMLERVGGDVGICLCVVGLCWDDVGTCWGDIGAC